MTAPVPSSNRQRYASVGLVAVVLMSTSAVAFGGGYRASQALLEDDSAYVVKGRTVAQVNGATGRADAEIAADLAKGTDKLTIRTTPEGTFLVNGATGAVNRIDTAAKTAGPANTQGKPGTTVTTGGGHVYFAAPDTTAVVEVDPVTMAQQTQVTLAEPARTVVADKAGTAWALGKTSGNVQAVSGGEVRATIKVAEPGAATLLTVVGGRAVVLDATADRVTPLSLGGTPSASRALQVDDLEGDVQVAEPTLVGTDLYAVATGNGDGLVLRVDLRTGQSVSAPLGLGKVQRLGAPVVGKDRLAVPDLGNRRLILLDRTLKRIAAVKVPTEGDFDVIVKGDRFYASDQYRRKGVIVGFDGQAVDMDKGPGHGVSEPQAPAAPTPPRPQTPLLPQTPLTPELPTQPTRPSGAGTPPRPSTDPVPSSAPTGRPGATPSATPSPKPTSAALPETVGMQVGDACVLVKKAGFTTCTAVEDAASDQAPGTVISSDPVAGGDVPFTTPITLTHAKGTQVPTLVGLSAKDACDALVGANLVCTRSPQPTAAPAGEKALIVLTQDQEAGKAVSTGTAVTIAYHSKVVVPAYDGQAEAACTAARDLGLNCQGAPGGSAARTGKQVNDVQSQDPAPSSELTVNDPEGGVTGQTVTLTYYSNRALPVGTYTGVDPGTAVARCNADGFSCRAEVRRPYRNPNVVQEQSQGAGGSIEEGSEVVVYYDDRVPTQLQRWKKGGEAVWVLTADNRTGELTGLGYTMADGVNQDLGVAYGAGQPGDGLRAIYSYSCSCDSHTEQHYYDSLGAPAGYAQGAVAFYLFADDTAGHSRAVHRLRRFNTPKGVRTVDYAYASDPGTLAYYQGQTGGMANAFVDEGIIGFTWPS